MSTKTYIIFLPFLLLCSCNQKKVDTEIAFEYYDSVNHELTVNKALQQRLIDQALTVLLLMDNDKNAVIDTKSFSVLLDSAKILNADRIENIKKINEIDNSINYKSKVLEYAQHLQHLYKNEFEEYIDIMNKKGVDRSALARKILLPQLVATKEKEQIFKEAQEIFKDKYNRDEIGKKRVKGEYEYINLSTLGFEMVEIGEGTPINLVSYSGGSCNEINFLYKQFIGINTANGDTIRILAFCKSQEYDMENAPRAAIFRKNYFHDDYKIPDNEKFVIFNKGLQDIEKGKYKTTFGTLEF